MVRNEALHSCPGSGSRLQPRCEFQDDAISKCSQGSTASNTNSFNSFQLVHQVDGVIESVGMDGWMNPDSSSARLLGLCYRTDVPTSCSQLVIADSRCPQLATSITWDLNLPSSLWGQR